MDIVLTGFIALEETLKIAKENTESLMARFPKVILDRLLLKESCLDTEKTESALSKENLSYVSLGKGGLFRGLWELGETFDTGISVYLDRVVLLQEIVEITEYMGLNPYMMDSKGAFLIRTLNGNELIERLSALNIDANIIGNATNGNDRVVFYDENVLYLTPYKEEK